MTDLPCTNHSMFVVNWSFIFAFLSPIIIWCMTCMLNINSYQVFLWLLAKLKDLASSNFVDRKKPVLLYVESLSTMGVLVHTYTWILCIFADWMESNSSDAHSLAKHYNETSKFYQYITPNILLGKRKICAALVQIAELYVRFVCRVD